MDIYPWFAFWMNIPHPSVICFFKWNDDWNRKKTAYGWRWSQRHLPAACNKIIASCSSLLRVHQNFWMTPSTIYPNGNKFSSEECHHHFDSLDKDCRRQSKCDTDNDLPISLCTSRFVVIKSLAIGDMKEGLIENARRQFWFRLFKDFQQPSIMELIPSECSRRSLGSSSIPSRTMAAT